jgi:hypothetical protein
MSTQINLVNLGTYPNDGTGDDLRTAFEKINSSVVLTVENLGAGAPLFAEKSFNALEFRGLLSANNNLTITYNSESVILTVPDSIKNVEGDLAPKLGGDLDLNGFNITGPGNFIGQVVGTVSSLDNHNIEALANVSDEEPNIGDVLVWTGEEWKPNTGLSNDFDFGVLNKSITNPLEMFLQFSAVDFGAITNPTINVVDLRFISNDISYTLVSNKPTIVKGQTVRFIVFANNVQDNTALTYAISGVNETEIAEPLSGTIVVINGVAFLDVTISSNIILGETTRFLTFNVAQQGLSLSLVIEEAQVIDGGGPDSIPTFLVDGGPPDGLDQDTIYDGGIIE